MRCTPLWGSSRNCWGAVLPTKPSLPSTSSLSSSIWPLEQRSDLRDDLDLYIESSRPWLIHSVQLKHPHYCISVFTDFGHFFDHQILYLLRVQCICLCFLYIKLVLFNLSSAYIHTLIVYTYGTCIYVIYTVRYNSTMPVLKNKIFDARFQPQKSFVLLINKKTNYYYIH